MQQAKPTLGWQPPPQLTKTPPMNSVQSLRTVSWLEGASYILLLFVAMPLKYFAGMPMAVRVTGMAHGLLFVLLVYALLRVLQSRQLTVKQAFMVFMASLIPFGPFLVDKMLVSASRETKNDAV
jgi:integral membrane protein